MCRGLAKENEMLKLRKMVVELCSNMNKIISTSDRRFVDGCVRAKRRFTNAEANLIASLHHNLKNPQRRKTK